MPFEVLDVDIAIPENRDAFLESYAFFRHHQSDDSESFDEPGTFATWVKESPEEATNFLEFCNTHEDPEVRRLAGEVAIDDFIEDFPDLALDIVIARMNDEDPIVNKAVTRFVFDILTDRYGSEGLLQKIGLLKTTKLIRAYKQATKLTQS